jgi:hypothetical protein
MRKIVYCILLVALMSGVAQAYVLPVHQYTFNDTGDPTPTDTGTLANADGTFTGSALSYGGMGFFFTEGDYMNMDGATIAINTYSEVTMEFWSTQDFDQGWTMLGAFGDTIDGWRGASTLNLSTSRMDNVTRSSVSNADSSEVGVNGYELNDGLEHHYVVTVGAFGGCMTPGDMITLYIDGQLFGAAFVMGRTLSILSNNHAYLAKSTWGDPTWIGYINEFNIYDYAMSCEDVVERYLTGPIPIPEPATLALLGLGSLVLIRRKK